MRSLLSLGSITSNPKTTIASSVVTPTGNIVATGGTVTTGTDDIGDYKIHTFTANGTFEISECYENARFEVLIVGAGGSGSGSAQYQYIVPYPFAGGWITRTRGGQGGGGGGIIYLSNKELSIGRHEVIVGQSTPSKNLYELIDFTKFPLLSPDWDPNWGFQLNPFATGQPGLDLSINGITGVWSSTKMGSKGQDTHFAGYTACGGYGGDSLITSISAPMVMTLPFNYYWGSREETRYIYLKEITAGLSKTINSGSFSLASSNDDTLYCESHLGGVGQKNASFVPNNNFGPNGTNYRIYGDDISIGKPYGQKYSISGNTIEYGAGGETIDSGNSNLGTPGTGGNGDGSLGQNGIVIIKYYTNRTDHKVFFDGGKISADKNYTYHEFNENHNLLIKKLPPDSKFDILISHIGHGNGANYNPVKLVEKTNQLLEYNSLYKIRGLSSAARGKVTGASICVQDFRITTQDLMYKPGTVNLIQILKQPYDRDYWGNLRYKIPCRIKSATGFGAEIYLIAEVSYTLQKDGVTGETTGAIGNGYYYITDYIVVSHGEGYRDMDLWEIDYVSGVGSRPVYMQGFITVDGNRTWNQSQIYYSSQADRNNPDLPRWKTNYPATNYDITLEKTEYSKYVPSKNLQTWIANTSLDGTNNIKIIKSDGYQKNWYEDTLYTESEYGNTITITSNTSSSWSNVSEYLKIQANTGCYSNFTGELISYGYSSKISNSFIEFMQTDNYLIWGNKDYYVSQRRKYDSVEDKAKVIIKYKSHIDGYIPESQEVKETTVSGSVLYETPGIHYWVCPQNVHSVCVVAIGGGGAGGINYPNERADGGGGGALAWKNNIPVVPGQKYILKVGKGGKPNEGGIPNLEDIPEDLQRYQYDMVTKPWPSGNGQGGKKSFFIDDWYVCAGGGEGGSGGNRNLYNPFYNNPYRREPEMSDKLRSFINQLHTSEQSSKYDGYFYNTNTGSYEDYNSSFSSTWIYRRLYIPSSSGGHWIGDGGGFGGKGGTASILNRQIGEGGNYKLSPYNGINPLDYYNYSGGGGGAGGYGNSGKAGGGSAGTQYKKTNTFVSVNEKYKPENTLNDAEATPGSGGAGTSPYGLGANGVNGLINVGGTTGSPNNSIFMPSLNGGSPHIDYAYPSSAVSSSQYQNTWWPGKGGKYGGGSGGNGVGGYDEFWTSVFDYGSLSVYFSNMGQGDSGGDGAVRIIWGPNRSFPSSNTASP